MPEVTVIMSVYNGMPYLPEAVDSIINQTVQDFIFLIVNDGSTDGSTEYLNQLTDKRIRVIHQANRGQGAARNVGFALCESEFIAMMDADDVAFQPRLEAQLHFLYKNKEVGMVGTKFVFLSPSGNRGFSPPLPNDHETIYKDLLRGRHALCQATLTCRASIIKKIGGFRVDGCGEDLDFWLRMGEISRLANLNEVLYGCRIHSASVNTRHQAEVQRRYAHARSCAQKRAIGQPELTYNEFLVQYSARPFWQRGVEVMDVYALGQYRRALAEILSSHRVRGYVRLIWAALCSPRWTAQRLSRAIRKRSKS